MLPADAAGTPVVPAVTEDWGQLAVVGLLPAPEPPLHLHNMNQSHAVCWCDRVLLQTLPVQKLFWCA